MTRPIGDDTVHSGALRTLRRQREVRRAWGNGVREDPSMAEIFCFWSSVAEELPAAAVIVAPSPHGETPSARRQRSGAMAGLNES